MKIIIYNFIIAVKSSGQAGGQLLTIVYTVRGSRIRLISARKATKNEREIYYKNNT
ncbi:hypothetical protein C7H19_13685 [Aphanothece hegewaldii CCALA 016]|uniref:BrnT family toxin n=1 Tax=Aphanothece hegewaldii CCALA 016 TaxID=2107694 RepID=A0A2T1LWI5_9CHRO|nr:hypothetical protein C7H19_13685 [Aphanothece hegewaldii CCALA 016]